MIFNTGATSRLGKVDDGNTVADYLPEEVKKKITISTSLVPCEYRDHKINVLDTPGFADFYFEVVGAARVTDTLVMMLSASAGVEVQTEVIWEDFPNTPKLVFINKMDRENSDFYKVLDQLKDSFSDIIVPVQLPIGSESNFKGVVDLVKMKAYIFEEGSGKMSEAEIPVEMMDDVEIYKEQLIEAAAEADDELLAKYLEGEELSDEEILGGIKKAAASGSAVFVFCGSALKNIGIKPFMDFVVDCAATPEDNPVYQDIDKSKLAIQVFKTIADPYIGRLNMFRVFSGTMKADSSYYNANKEKDERIAQLLVMTGKEQSTVPELHTGDIAAVAKLGPWFIPDTTRSIFWLKSFPKASFTQSTGVPFTIQADLTPLISIFWVRMGSKTVIEWPVPLLSRSGATTYKSPRVASSLTRALMPPALIPSSLVSRIFTPCHPLFSHYP
jgi:elongation factor G